MLSTLLGQQLKISAPDADLKEPVLKANGDNIQGTVPILKQSGFNSCSRSELMAVMGAPTPCMRAVPPCSYGKLDPVPQCFRGEFS